jgi:hypothetical protein
MKELEARYEGLAARRLAALPAPTTFDRPLSAIENELWSVARTMSQEGARGFALLRLAISLEGVIDVEVMKRAMAFVMTRHDAFRTSYRERDGRAVAHVDAQAQPVVEIVDMEADAGGVEAWFEAQSHIGFHIGRAPLHRLVLVRLGPTEHRLCSFAHHLVCDGISYGLLVREIEASYRQILAGDEPKLPRELQYSEFAAWQAEWLDEAMRTEFARFWKRHLPVGPLRAPIAAVGDRVGSPERSRWAVFLRGSDPEVGARLRAFCRAGHHSIPHVLFAILVTMLELEDAGGSPIGYMSANRRFETVRIVGLFASMFPVRVAVDRSDTFQSVLERSLSAVDEAIRYQDLPPRFAPPPYRVVFSFGGMSGDNPVAIEGVRSRVLSAYEKQRALFDLWLNLAVDNTGKLWMKPEYNADLLDEETVRAYLVRFEAVLAAALADPRRTIAELASVRAVGAE